MLNSSRMKIALAPACFALTLTMLSACSTPHPSQTLGDVSKVGEYKLSGGDDLRILVYGEDRLSGEYHVSSQGMISMATVGDINAEGLTLAELRNALITAFQNKGILTTANVSVDLLSYRPFYVLGEVNAPGQYPYVPKMNVLQAIATAKGYTYRAKQNIVFVTHRGEATETRFELTPGAAVLPGDTIRVPERHF